MTILLKNKHTLKIDDFHFRCSIGKNGISKKKKEGDYNRRMRGGNLNSNKIIVHINS